MKYIQIFKLKVFLFIFVYFGLISISYSHNHFPITTDSKLMIIRGKIAYENNCISCHMINLAGAENWKSIDEDGHGKGTSTKWNRTHVAS